MQCDYCLYADFCNLIMSENDDCLVFHTKAKAGDAVYAITKKFDDVNRATTYCIKELKIAILHSEDMMLVDKDNHIFYYRQNDIGKLIFYNYDMAQKVLDMIIGQGGISYVV